MGYFGSVIENFFDGKKLKHYHNMVRFKESLIMLKNRDNFNFIWYKGYRHNAKVYYHFYPEEHELDESREIYMEINLEKKIKAIHITYNGTVRLINECEMNSGEGYTREDIRSGVVGNFVSNLNIHLGYSSNYNSVDAYYNFLLSEQEELINKQTGNWPPKKPEVSSKISSVNDSDIPF